MLSAEMGCAGSQDSICCLVQGLNPLWQWVQTPRLSDYSSTVLAIHPGRIHCPANSSGSQSRARFESLPVFPAQTKPLVL